MRRRGPRLQRVRILEGDKRQVRPGGFFWEMNIQLKRIAGKSKTMVIAYRVYDNWRKRRQFNAGNVESIYGSTHSKMTLFQSLRYINDVFEDYLSYSGLTRESFRDRRIF